MGYYIYLVLLFNLYVPSLYTTEHNSTDPLVVVVLMVKNEESFMIPTLKPFVEGGITSFIIFDTGSTDKTIETTRRYFNAHGITQGYIFQEPFIDFATSRNRALVFAEKKFPNAGFFLMPDAEWYFENVPGLLTFCSKEIQKTGSSAPHSYLIKLISNTIDFYQQRLIRNGRQLRFAGVVHETISIGTAHQIPNNIYFQLGVSRQGLAKTKKRWSRDKELLLKEHNNHPTDPRITFYLAQTYFCLGELENAYTYYTLRTTLGGFDQEVADSYFKLGKIALSLSKKDKAYTWDKAFNHFLSAYASRPWRAEPLVEIARYYVEQNELALAYLFLRRAIEIPYPDKEILFVEKLPYLYERYDLLGRCAWSSGAFELGEWAIKKALEFAPHMPHLHQNLACYLNRKKQLKEDPSA